MMGEGFEMDLHTLELFFRVCRRYQIPEDGRELRIALLRQLVKRKQAHYISNPAEYLKDRNIKRMQ